MASIFLGVFSLFVLANSFGILFVILALAQIVAIDGSAIRSIIVLLLIYRKKDSVDLLDTDKSCRIPL